MMTKIQAPFTPAQVQAINQSQVGVRVTAAEPVLPVVQCPYKHERLHGIEGGALGVLVANADGLRCPHCGYAQDWAMEPPEGPTPPTPQDAGAGTSRAEKEWTAAMLRIVHQRLTLYKVLHQTLGGTRLEPTDPPAPRSAQGLIEEMLRSLRRVSMALQGVETRPGHPRGVSAPWRPTQTLPQPGQPIDVLMQYVAQPGVPEVYNPMHPGFGPSAWVSEDGFYDPLMGQVGAIVLAAETGTVTHWRPAGAGLPDSALDGALMAEVPSTPQEVRAWLRDFAGVEATRSADDGLADRYTLSAWTLIQALHARARWVPTRKR